MLIIDIDKNPNQMFEVGDKVIRSGVDPNDAPVLTVEKVHRMNGRWYISLETASLSFLWQERFMLYQQPYHLPEELFTL